MNLKKRTIKKGAKRFLVSFLLAATVMWSTGMQFLFMAPVARAVSTISVSTEGLPTQMPGEKIAASSFDMPILKVSVTASQVGQALQAVTVNFSGTGFATTDLAAIATGNTSGVALYDDTNNNGFYNPGGTDAVITLAASPDWTPATTNITLTPATPFSLPNGTAKVFFIVIKTSAGITTGDRIIATIPSAAVITSDGNGPAANFSANYLEADNNPASIQLVSGASGSNNLNVKFSKPVRKFGAGFNPIAFVNGTDPFIFTDNGGGAKAVTGVTHSAGQDFAIVTLSGNLGAGDIDGTPSTLNVALNAISDMGGVAVVQGAVAVSNPLTITTASIPSTVVGANHSGTPLVTFAASGGTPAYTWETASAGDTTVLTTLGLTLATNGALTSATTVANVPGSYSVNIKVTDSVAANNTRMFNINVAPSGGGGIPGIVSVTPGGGPKGAVSMPITVTGINTHFSGSSTVQFWKAGANDTDMTVSGIASSSATSLTFNLAIAAGATEGTRDVKIATGAEQATMPNGFNVFASGGSGLGLLMPSDAATGVQMPPNFNFDPSTNGTINSYRITLNTTSNFAGTTLWDYVYPKPNIGNTNNSHCNDFGCNVVYGEGRFMILTPPTPLAPNTTYYWRVRTYTETPGTAISSATAVESTVVRSFTTTASMSDVEPPMVMHRPIFQATASTDLNVIARVMDNLATATSTPALTTKLYYCAGAACNPTTEAATPTFLGAGYYKYIIPGATINTAGTIIRYYISATDGTNTRSFKQPDGTTPFQLTSVAAGSANSITGNVDDTSNADLSGVLVFAEGTGFLSAATGGDGNFTLGSNNLFAGTYDLVAIKEGYGDPMINGIPAGSTGIQFRLGQGFGGGFGGDTAKPRVKFTGPMDGMNGVPGNDLNFKIFVAFDKPMSQSKFTEVGNMLVKKITDFSTNPPTTVDVAGSWIYYSSNPGDPKLPPEGNLAVFTPSEVFGENKTILVSVTSNITDTAGNSVQSNQSDGSYSFMFTTSSNVVFSGNNIQGGTFGQGAFMPPHVTGTMPSPGAFDVPRNSKMIINFSDPMADDGGGYVLENNIALYTVSGGTESANIASSAIDTVLLDSSKTSATVTLLNSYNSGTFAASTTYRLKVLGGAKAANGMTIAPPDQASSPRFTSEFKTSASSDTAAPNIVGSYPSAGDTGTPVNIGAISVGFSKDMDMSTITTSNVYLSIGSTAVNGTIEYRGVERQAFFIPSTALNPNTTYTINVTTSVLGINGVAIAATAAQPLTRNFTTGGADSVTPEIMFMNADDYAVAITFSEPMNAAKATDTLNWSTSVLNPAVYNVIKFGAAGFDPVGTGTVVPFTSATFKYDATSSTLMIEGLALTAGQELYLSMDITGTPGVGAQIAKDLSGNGIATPKNIARAPIKSSAMTKGALGPMAMGDSAFNMGGTFIPTNFDSGTFGFAPPIDVKPFNMMAGQSTIYGVRLPISRQIPAGGSIVLTFPTGFDVATAQQDINSPMRQDLNGPGSGSPTFKCLTNVIGGKSCSGGATVTGDAAGDTTTKGALADDGIIINTSARSVTAYLSAATNSGGNDFLTIDISGIKNSTVPKDFNTSGYTVDIKTKSADGSTILESLTSMPFFIQSGGSNTLSGTITAAGASEGTTKVYLMSPMTGPMETTSATFVGGSAAYSFAGVPSGDFMLFTDPSITLGANSYVGKPMPEMVRISGATTYNITLASDSAGTAVTINVDGPSSEPLDIFAGSPTGFKVKQVTLDTNAGAQAFTFYLGDGQWFVGVGPQMPKGPMSGPPPAPNYMPPKPKDIRISNPNCTIEGSVGCSVTFTLTSSNKTIKGVVQDGSGKIMANAQVFGYSPTGGFGTNAQSDSAGNFTLNVVDGIYKVGAMIPGMPSSKEVSVIVNSDATKGGHATNYLYIDGATTGIPPATALTTFILKVAKPGFTISGKITDGTNVVQGAAVNAYRFNGPGNANANTDSSGNYTLYVSGDATTPHVWKVSAFLPQYGQLAEQTVTISTANATNINFTPTATGTFYTVSGRVYKDLNANSSYDSGEELSGVFVKLSGNSKVNESISAVDGTYSFKVPSGNGYVIKAFAPNIGELPSLASFNVGGNITDKDILVSTPRTLTVTFTSSVTEAFVELSSSTGVGNRIRVLNSTTGTMSLPDGSYMTRVGIPGVPISPSDIAGTGSVSYSSTTGIATITGNGGLTVTVPTLRTVSGTVKDASNNNIPNAWVELGNPSAGVHFGAQTDTNGAFSLQVANSSSDYFIQAMKPGYFSDPANITVNAGVLDASLASGTYTLTATSLTISGQVLVGSTGAANAFVRAEKQGGGFAGAQADPSGNYTLYVTAGTWKVYAVSEGYAEAAYASNPIVISTTSAENKNVTLSTQITLAAPKSKPITPASGGTLEDSTSGVKITVPANALGSSTSAGSIQSKETNNVNETSSAKPVKSYDSGTQTYVNAAKEIKATDSSGNAITTLNDAITVEMEYSLSELDATPSSGDASIDTKTEADNLKMGYWDETTSNWVTLPSTVTYKNSDGAVITDATTIDTPSEFTTNVATVLVSAPTTHFSLYAPVSSTNANAPATPTGLGATAASSSQINLSWTQVAGDNPATSYDIYRSTSSGGTYSRLGSEPTVSSGSTTTYSDTGLSASTAYYYKISALNASGESAVSSAVTATTSAASSGGGGGYTPPATTVTGASISIAGGLTSTESASVTLTIAATNATHMAISNTSSFDGASWEAFAISKAWTLTSGTGTKTVYVKFKDAAGVESAAISDTITLGTVVATETPTTETPTVTDQPEGTLFRYDNSPNVYVVRNGNQVWIQTLEEFNAAGYKWSDVKVISATVVKTVGSVTLLRAEGDNKVYVIHNNTRRHVKTAAEFNSAGYKWTDVKVVSVTELGTYTEEASAPETAKTATITASSLRIRSTNGTSGKVLGFVVKGDKYQVLEENGGWYKITTPSGKTGWILGSFTTVSGVSATTPSVEVSSAGTVIITTKWLRVRASNSTASTTLAFTKEGETYDILGESGNWFKIKTAKGITGWISKDYAKKQ